MKMFLQKSLQRILGVMARVVLWRHHPFVIGITGSIGKTTTKDALYTILREHCSVRTNIANYNNEIGVPLTIIGARTGGRSLVGWLRVAAVWLWTVVLQRQYPAVLVLELGIDHVGDMAYLVDMVAPQIGVVTVVHGVHAEKLGSVATIAREKGVLVRRLPDDGVAILNADDVRVAKMARKTAARVLTYSATNCDGAQVCASDIVQNGRNGIALKVNEGAVSVPVRLPHIIGTQMVPSILAAIAAARAYGMNLADIAQALEHFTPPSRRMNLIALHGDITVIDDSYNAAPASMRGALAALGVFPTQGRRIALLGDMKELGDVQEAEHRALADEIDKNAIDVVFCVGEQMQALAEQLHAHRAKVQHYASVDALLQTLEQSFFLSGDVVLLKGSNSMEMHKVLMLWST